MPNRQTTVVTTRVYRQPARPVRPARSVGPRPGTSVYVIHRPSPPPAVPPPQGLGPEAPAPDLQGPPPRSPFQRYLNRFPYEARRRGWVADPWKGNAKDNRRIGGRLAAEGSYLYRGLWRSGVSARVGSPRVDLDTQMSFYAEPAQRDAMYLGDTTINFAPIALPGIVWRVGVGARYMLDARLPGQGFTREYATGWNVSTSIDAFPGRPFVVSARLDRGTLFETPVWRARATAGITYRRMELFAGYDHTQLWRTSLGGPLIGLRAWL